MSEKAICRFDGHQFESYLVATVPPNPQQMNGASVDNLSPSGAQIIIESLTAKRYLVACKNCGMVLGGFVGDAKPKVDGTTERLIDPGDA